MDLDNNYIPPIKLKTMTNEDDRHDIYCFECHQEGVFIDCDSCPRVYHPECLGLIALSDSDWTCPECEIIQSSLNIINQPTPLQRHSVNEFHAMLKYAFHRMISHPQAEHFIRIIDSNQISNYLHYIVHPMDLETIEKNLNLKTYSSADAFIGDVKWIVHNTIVLNGNQNKLTNSARRLLKMARHEITEIEMCPECYLRSAQSNSTDCFTIPCSIPHTLCWAKMKTYQSWPAKVLRIVNNEVDVRFFGQHDRALVSLNNCFVLSKEYPGGEKKKSNINFEKSLTELQSHIDQLKKLYGHFIYAPLQTVISKTKPFKFISIIDDTSLPSYITAANDNRARRSSIKSSKQQRSSTKTSPPESDMNKKKSAKRLNENSHEHQQSAKRAKYSNKNLVLEKTSERSNNTNHRLSGTNSIEDDESQLTLNVFDIFNQTDQISSSIKTSLRMPEVLYRRRPSSPSDNKLRIQALVRKYTAQQSLTIDSIIPDVSLSMNALLDAVEAVKLISEVHTNIIPPSTFSQISTQLPLSEPHTRIKKPRKSRLQHHIITKNTNSDFITCPSLDQSLSSTLPMVPIRPLSVSPISVDMFEGMPSVTIDNISSQHYQLSERTSSIESLSVKVEPIDNEEYQVIQPTNLKNCFLISPPLNTKNPISTASSIVRSSRTASKKNIWLSALSINPSTRKPTSRKHKRSGSLIFPARTQQNGSTSSNSFSINSSSQRLSNGVIQSRAVSNALPISNQNSIQTPQYTNQPSLENHQIPGEIRMIINNFNDQFQHLLVDLTGQIESSLETNRVKYEKDLEETRRSYHLSLNDLHSITTEQIQEIHNSLELQYRKRLSEMRNRFESTLQSQ